VIEQDVLESSGEVDLCSAYLGEAVEEIFGECRRAVLHRTGEATSAGELAEDRPILRIAEVHPLRVEVVVPAPAFGLVVSGRRATVRPDSGPVREATGTVTIVDRVLDPASNTFRVRLALPNADMRIPAGSRCKVDDATLGNAHKVEGIQETWVQHVLKGGPVMWPIFALAGAALLVVLLKWLSMAFIGRPSRKLVGQLLESVHAGNREAS
jgi:hypothetical protein